MKNFFDIIIQKLPDIIIGFSIPFIIYLGKKVVGWHETRTIIKQQSFLLNGIWVARFYSLDKELNQILEKPAIEFLYLEQHGNFIKGKLQHFDSGKNYTCFFNIIGIIRLETISLCYYAVKQDSKQTGIMSLKVKKKYGYKTQLAGNFFEAIENENDYNQYPKDYYRLNKLEKPALKMRLDMLCGRSCQSNYTDALNFVDEFLKEEELL